MRRDGQYACLAFGALALIYLLVATWDDGQGQGVQGGFMRVKPHVEPDCLADVNVTGTVYSQFGQDAYLAKNVFPAATTPPGVYVELGAYHPTRFSNTALFDKCYGWKGLCIDMNPFHKAAFEAQRSCEFVHTCIAFNKSHVDYYLSDNDLGDGKEGVHRVTCQPFDALLAHHKILHIDLLSIDIEGGEMGALRTFPFDKVYVHAILVETWHIGKEVVFDFLEDRGFVHKAELGPDDLFLQTQRPWLPPQTAEWRKAIRGAHAGQ
jgi:hypothetical protein